MFCGKRALLYSALLWLNVRYLFLFSWTVPVMYPPSLPPFYAVSIFADEKR